MGKGKKLSADSPDHTDHKSAEICGFLLSFCYAVLGFPFAVYKAITTPRFRAGWGERLGGTPDLPSGHRIWIHCASVGEVMLVRSFVAKLKTEYPEADIVISTNTSTGHETALKNFPGLTVFYFPLDLSAAVRRAFGRIKPSAVVLVELELWPNFLAVARRRGVPVVVVNGRITERSARRHRMFGAMSRCVLGRVAHFAVQNEEYAARLEGLGVGRDRISVSGTMKYDSVATEVAPEVVAGYRRALRLAPGENVVIGGCTHSGEDELLIEYAKEQMNRQDAKNANQNLRLILVPRHRERADAVERLIREAGLVPVRKTAIDAGTVPEGFERQAHVILVDTTGELARLYSVATVAFVGGSLVPHGGQNMIEPAALGVATVFGPHTRNFRDTVELLRSGRAAIEVEKPEMLGPVLDGLLENAAQRDELGRRARQLVEECKGATERNFMAVRLLLQPPVRETV